MARRLLIVDHYDSPAFGRAALQAEAGEPWDVFLLGRSPEWFAWRHPETVARLRGCRLLDAAPVVADAHALVNEFVVRTSERLPHLDLGGRTLLDLCRGPRVNGWWFLQTAEKGPYRTPLIGQLYRVALARLMAEHSHAAEVWFSIREEALARALASGITSDSGWTMTETAPAQPCPRLERHPFVRLGLMVSRALGRFALTRAFCVGLESPPGRSAGGTGRWAFTVFPSWWARASSSTPGDRFLTHVREAGFEGYFAWLTEPLFLWRHGSAVRLAARSLRLVALQRFLSLGDALTIISPARFRRLWVYERRMRNSLRLDFLGCNVGPLFGSDISRSLSSQEPIQDELLSRALGRAAERHAPGLVVYRAEFQPIESAVLTGLRGRAKTIGFHHHPFGRNYPQMHFTSAQIRESTTEVPHPDVRPLPDGVIAIGPALARNLSDGGYPSDRVRVCGPQRYGPLTAYRSRPVPAPVLRQRLGLPATVLVVFVSLAIVEADTEALFGALVAACGDTDDIQFVIKTHPNRPDGDPALHATLESLGRARARLMPDRGSMYDYIAAADCMLCIGSMIAFEAMALGIMPIVFDNPSTYASVSLAAYEEGLFNVRNARELREAIEEVRLGSDRTRDKRQRWPDLLAGVLGDLERPLVTQMHEALRGFQPDAPAGAVQS
ncbi:MAG TPA: hypothetical protein VNJ03_04130 [Vicinamibacterales bacterium]|nr:hypothetical protein [Vicinamibacterales bacterium]